MSMDIYGAQQRLDYIGYDVELNGIYDNKTANALLYVQLKNDLKKYALYQETKDMLDELVKYKQENDDKHLNQAIDWIKAQ